MNKFSDQAPVAAVLTKFPGAEIVDVRHPTDDEAPLQGKASSKGKSLSMLADLAEGESHRIRARQQELVESGDREAPNDNAMLRADCFDAISRILKTCAGDKLIVEQLRKAATS